MRSYKGVMSVVLFALLIGASGCMEQAVARAGADRTVAAGDLVELDASASRPENANRISYAWEVIEGDGITLADPTAAKTTFTAPQKATETRITVQLTVTYVDLGGSPVPSNSDTDEVLVRVRADRTLTTDVGEEDTSNQNDSIPAEEIPPT